MWNNQGGFQSYDQQGGQQGGYMSPGGFGTPQASQDRKTRQRVQNLLPVTVAELINATQNEDKFYTGDIEISQITIVGLVKSVKESPTRLDYEIDDMSGPPLEVKQFVDNDDSVPDTERVQAMRENTYVRVCGHVRAFGGKRSVVAFKMVPIVDMNELTCHLLEVVHSHMALSQGSSMNTTEGGMKMTTGGDPSFSGGMGGGETVSGLSPIQNQVSVPSSVGLMIGSGDSGAKNFDCVPSVSVIETLLNFPIVSPQIQQMYGFFNLMSSPLLRPDINTGHISSDFMPLQIQVHLLVRGNMTDQGASIDSICQQLRGVPEKSIRDAIEFLSSEGHIYSTIDEDHYKATDS